MICSESCNSSQGGPMMSTPVPKNEVMTLCVARLTRYFPILNVLAFALILTGCPPNKDPSSILVTEAYDAAGDKRVMCQMKVGKWFEARADGMCYVEDGQ